NGWEPPPYREIPRVQLLGVVWLSRKTWATKGKGWGFANHWQFPVSRQHLFTQPIHFRAKCMLGLFNIPDDILVKELEPLGILTAKQLAKQLEFNF
ncbi:MAG TPA: hypothetical protein V6C57_16750, partial [Coleofasciculaceae cyanobacterium]